MKKKTFFFVYSIQMQKNIKTDYYGHRQRLRQRFEQAGSAGMHGYELIEILLTYCIKQKDVKPVAKQLMKKFQNISNILDADRNELMKIKGLGEYSITLIRLIKEFCAKYFENKLIKKNVLSSPAAVIKFARVRISSLAHETMMVIFLNTRNEVIHHHLIHEGTIDQVIIYPRQIIEKTLYYHASGLILIHNHPTGSSQPSREDRHLTEKLKELLQQLDILLLDHIIVTKEAYYSFKENNIL